MDVLEKQGGGGGGGGEGNLVYCGWYFCILNKFNIYMLLLIYTDWRARVQWYFYKHPESKPI